MGNKYSRIWVSHLELKYPWIWIWVYPWVHSWHALVRPLWLSGRYSDLHKGHIFLKFKALPCEANLLICRNRDSGIDTVNFWSHFAISAKKFCKCRITDGFSYNSAHSVPLNKLCIVLYNEKWIDVCVQNWEPSWAATYDVICPRVLQPVLLSWRKVDRLRSLGSGYGSQKGLSDWCHLNSMMISVRATSIGPRHSQSLVYTQMSGLMSKLNPDWPEQSAFGWVHKFKRMCKSFDGCHL